jgi:uncharacterized protein (TIGR02466 family)
MEIFGIFSTNIFVIKCNLDLKELEKKCYDFKKKNESKQSSNAGGYQGLGFVHQELNDIIYASIPKNDRFKIKDFQVQKWININKPGDYIPIHRHDPFNGVIFSGVFYVKTPKNCGNLIFHDPRSIIKDALDQEYYNNGINTCFIEPEENKLVIFPSWIDHEAEKNESNEDRISIAFNLYFDFE